MMAGYKLEQARDLAGKHPKLFPDIAEGLDSLVALHRARLPEERGTPAPNVQAQACTIGTYAST